MITRKLPEGYEVLPSDSREIITKDHLINSRDNVREGQLPEFVDGWIDPFMTVGQSVSKAYRTGLYVARKIQAENIGLPLTAEYNQSTHPSYDPHWVPVTILAASGEWYMIQKTGKHSNHHPLVAHKDRIRTTK